MIVSDPYINESIQGAKLLIKWLLNLFRIKQKTISEPKLCGRLRKKFDPLAPPASQNNALGLLDPSQLDLDTLASQIISQQSIFLITKTVSKIHKPIIYKKTINATIHKRKWREVIKDKLQNLEDYYTWEYKELPSRRKAIGSK